MKCPVCNKKMNLKARDVAYGHGDKKYNRTIYTCEDCDSWTTEEVLINEK